jgi:hypothetical protein
VEKCTSKNQKRKFWRRLLGEVRFLRKELILMELQLKALRRELLRQIDRYRELEKSKLVQVAVIADPMVPRDCVYLISQVKQ